MLKKTTEGTEIHGVFVINLVFSPCNSAYSVVNHKKIPVVLVFTTY
jgi:hypothetical protein